MVAWARGSTRNLAVLLVAVMVLVSVVALGVTSWSSSHYGDLEYLGFDADRVYSIESQLTSWPTRHTGTVYEREAAEYIASEFMAAGLENVHIEEYQEVEYEVLGASLQLIYYSNGPLGMVPQPNRDPVVFKHGDDFVVQAFSGSRDQGTGPTSFRNDLGYVGIEGNGTEESMYAPATGMAAIVPSAADVSNRMIFDVAHDAGVTALILHNLNVHANIGYVPISKSNRQPEGWPDPSYPDIPFIMVSKDAGDLILAAQNAKLRLNVDVDIGVRTVHCAVGEVPGIGDSGEFIVIGAHHDCVYIGKGAIDNGSGVTTVVELAHQLAEARVERTIRLVTFGGEEDGLFGSFDYVEAHQEEIDSKCVGMLNFDMPHVNLQRANQGWITPDNEDRFGVFEQILSDINEDRPDLEERFDYNVELMEHPGEVGSDSMPFALAGVETVNFWGSGCWEYHTNLETMSHFMPEGLEMAVLIGGSYAMWLADHA